MNTIGTVYKNLALYESAEQMLLDSLAIRRQTFGNEDPRVVAALISLGELQDLAGEPDTAEGTLREALALARSVQGPSSLAAGEAMNDIANVIGQPRRHEYDAAADFYRQAIEIYTREKGPEDRDTRAIKTNLAVLLGRLRRPEEAEALLRENLASARADRGPLHPEVANICSVLSYILERERRLTEAEALLRTAYSIARETVGDDHPRTAEVTRRLALDLMAQGRHREAEPLLRDAQSAWKVSYRDKDADARAHVAADLGLLLGSLGQTEEGESQLTDAIAMYRRLYDDNSRYVALAQTKLADILLRSGRAQEALRIVEEAHSKLASEPVLLAYAASVQAAALAALGRATEAETLVPELRPPSRPPALSERVMMARALELYSGWASQDASEALKAELTAEEYLPISLR
jgi:tetratricopeptide (TPR) repeat protein